MNIVGYSFEQILKDSREKKKRAVSLIQYTCTAGADNKLCIRECQSSLNLQLCFADSSPIPSDSPPVSLLHAQQGLSDL